MTEQAEQPDNIDAELLAEKAKAQALVDSLNELWIGDSECDGTAYNCASCTAVRLRTELLHWIDHLDWMLEPTPMQVKDDPVTENAEIDKSLCPSIVNGVCQNHNLQCGYPECCRKV